MSETTPKKPARQSHFVYVIGTKGGPVKIGYSNNPEFRLHQIQTGQPMRVSVLRTFAVPSKRMGNSIETRCFELLRERRMNGEWYAINSNTAVHAVSYLLGETTEPPSMGPDSYMAHPYYNDFMKIAKMARSIAYKMNVVCRGELH
jgi:hypothetical protein